MHNSPKFGQSQNEKLCSDGEVRHIADRVKTLLKISELGAPTGRETVLMNKDSLGAIALGIAEGPDRANIVWATIQLKHIDDPPAIGIRCSEQDNALPCCPR